MLKNSKSSRLDTIRLPGGANALDSAWRCTELGDSRAAWLATAFFIGNVLFPQMTEICPQSSAGKRSSGWKYTFSTALGGCTGPSC